MNEDNSVVCHERQGAERDDAQARAGGRPQRRGVRIYPASGAVDNATTGFRGVTRVAPETGERLLALHEAGCELGFQSKLLVRQTDEEGGFSLLLVWGKPNYPLPRHSHMSDCMYFVVSGSATMGNVTLRAGDSFYAPSGAPYQYTAGPDGIEVLEIRRNVDTIGTQMSDVSPETAERYRQATEANRDLWAAMDVSPTFSANHQAANQMQEDSST